MTWQVMTCCDAQCCDSLCYIMVIIYCIIYGIGYVIRMIYRADIRYAMLHHDMLWFDIIQHGMLWGDMVCYTTIPDATIWHYMRSVMHIYIYIYICMYIYIYIHICSYIGTGLMGTLLNGYLVLQGNIPLFRLLDLCVSSLRRGHANLLCIVPILTDDPRRESIHRKTVCKKKARYPLGQVPV